MPDITNINTSDFIYDLSNEKIAYYPCDKRSDSKLLIYKNNIIKEAKFKDLPDNIDNCFFVFNDTKVIPSRLIFQKPTGAYIEIFCLEPKTPSNYPDSFNAKSHNSWYCLIGNKKKWKQGELIASKDNIKLYANLQNDKAPFVVKFEWTPNYSFSDILNIFGQIPLPPYIKRELIDDDKKTYQTVFAQNQGSVAAPTAGLHFTAELIEKIKQKSCIVDYITLHVGAGTFTPVSSQNVSQHIMHNEWIIIKKNSIENLLKYCDKPIIAVGTTSVRSLESIYWFGVELINSKNKNPNFYLTQWAAYENNNINYSKKEVLTRLLEYMNHNNVNSLIGNTQLMIVPGYKFKMIDIIITNFHQPASSLLMLVAAFIGDAWKNVYDYALKNNFRFLSYGDACLFFNDKPTII